MTEIKKHDTEYLSFHEVNVIKNPPIEKEIAFATSEHLQAIESVETIQKPNQQVVEQVVDESTWKTLSDLVAVSSILNHSEPENAHEIDQDSLNYDEIMVIDGQSKS